VINAIISGIALGLLLSILIGPVFFLLIKTSIYDGFKSAMYLELGICLSDAVCIFIAYIGLANLLQEPSYKPVISWIGGIVLIVFGIITYRQKIKLEKKINIPKRDDYIKLIIRGFLFNITNPSVIFFWIGAVGIAVSQFQSNKLFIATYFLFTLLVVIAIDILKAKLALRLSKSINDSKLSLLSKIAGIIILLFGVGIIVKLFI
jgi:threonine/homoserine/homoserine lactone efflux protein